MSQQKILIGDIISRYAAGERDFSDVIIKTPFGQSGYWQPDHFKGLDLSGIILHKKLDTNPRIYPWKKQRILSLFQAPDFRYLRCTHKSYLSAFEPRNAP